MENKWTKFDDTDIYYKIDEEDNSMVILKSIEHGVSKEITLFFDEIEEVYNKMKL